MIPKHELRIGNWVVNKEGKFCKLETGAAIDIANSFTPIAIDEEVLRKCGFNFHSYFKVWQKLQVLPKTGYLLEMDQDYNVRDFSQMYMGVRITTVHQLQNFLYQLRGVEIDFEIDENLNVEDVAVKGENFSVNTI